MNRQAHQSAADANIHLHAHSDGDADDRLRKTRKTDTQVPANNAILNTTRPMLKWKAALCATKYKVRVKDATTGLTLDKATLDTMIGVTVYKYKTDPLPTNTLIKWFVKACNGTFGCAKSAARYFTIQ